MFFFPTAYKDNTFGVILELDYSVKKNSEFRNQQIAEIYEISKNIEEKRFAINARAIIQENSNLKEKIDHIINVLKENQVTFGNAVFLLPAGFYKIFSSDFGFKITNGTCTLNIFKYDDDDLQKYVNEYKNSKLKENIEVNVRYFTMGSVYVCKSISIEDPYVVHYWFIHNRKVYSIYTEDASKNIDMIVSQLINSLRNSK